MGEGRAKEKVSLSLSLSLLFSKKHTSRGKTQHFNGIFPVADGGAGDGDALEDHLSGKGVADRLRLSLGHPDADEGAAETEHLLTRRGGSVS